jgi:hypothetical protein
MKEEVTNILKSAKPRKAAGPDEVVLNFLSQISPNVLLNVILGTLDFLLIDIRAAKRRFSISSSSIL